MYRLDTALTAPRRYTAGSVNYGPRRTQTGATCADTGHQLWQFLAEIRVDPVGATPRSHRTAASRDGRAYRKRNDGNAEHLRLRAASNRRGAGSRVGGSEGDRVAPSGQLARASRAGRDWPPGRARRAAAVRADGDRRAGDPRNRAGQPTGPPAQHIGPASHRRVARVVRRRGPNGGRVRHRLSSRHAPVRVMLRDPSGDGGRARHPALRLPRAGAPLHGGALCGAPGAAGSVPPGDHPSARRRLLGRRRARGQVGRHVHGVYTAGGARDGHSVRRHRPGRHAIPVRPPRNEPRRSGRLAEPPCRAARCLRCVRRRARAARPGAAG